MFFLVLWFKCKLYNTYAMNIRPMHQNIFPLYALQQNECNQTYGRRCAYFIQNSEFKWRIFNVKVTSIQKHCTISYRLRIKVSLTVVFYRILLYRCHELLQVELMRFFLWPRMEYPIHALGQLKFPSGRTMNVYDDEWPKPSTSSGNGGRKWQEMDLIAKI